MKKRGRTKTVFFHLQVSGSDGHDSKRWSSYLLEKKDKKKSSLCVRSGWHGNSSSCDDGNVCFVCVCVCVRRERVYVRVSNGLLLKSVSGLFFGDMANLSSTQKEQKHSFTLNLSIRASCLFNLYCHNQE